MSNYFNLLFAVHKMLLSISLIQKHLLNGLKIPGIKSFNKVVRLITVANYKSSYDVNLMNI